MKCNLFILNRNLELLGSIDDSESVIVSKRYNGIDDIQISISKTKENTDLLAYGNYVVVNNRIDTIFRIYKRTEMLSAGGEQINVLGYSVEKLLSQRVTMPPVDNTNLEVENTISNVAYTYINESCIDNIQRKELNFSKMGIGATVENDLIIKDSTRYKPLYDEIQRLCNLNDYGTKTYLDMTQSKVLVEVYRGEDKTFGNTEGNIPIVFSRDYENIINTSLDYDYTVVKNDIIAGGDGVGKDRVVAYVNEFNTQAINWVLNPSFQDFAEDGTLLNWNNSNTQQRVIKQNGGNSGSSCIALVPTGIYQRIESDTITLIPNHKYYFSSYYRKYLDGNTRVLIYDETITTTIGGTVVLSDNQSRWTQASTTFTNTTHTGGKVLLYGSYSGYKADMSTYWDSVVLVDLTATFGEGKEPSKAWCDANMPYFNGVRNIPTQEAPLAEDIISIFKDARDLKSIGDLIIRAESEFVQPQVSIDGAINPFVAYEYLKDYQLGDKVTLFINGNRFDERIVECVETYENNNFKLQVIFGQKVYDITDVIKQQTKSIKQLEVI